MSLNLVFIGAGNLATQLSLALKKKGYRIEQIFSRTEKSAKLLADKLNTEYTTNCKDIILGADVYFITVSDSAIEQILQKVEFKNKLIVHCAGSLPISVLEKYSENFGVFYPLQTFSKNRDLDFAEVPVFLEANTSENAKILTEMANELSNNVFFLNSEKRKMLHISAVFSCNFVNHLYNISKELLNSKDISFDVLKPLIAETALKIKTLTPEEAQTGPAIRYDENIIESHLKELNEMKDYKKIYKMISKSINHNHQTKKADDVF